MYNIVLYELYCEYISILNYSMDEVQGVEHSHGVVTLLLRSNHHSVTKSRHPLSVGKVPELTGRNYICTNVP